MLCSSREFLESTPQVKRRGTAPETFQHFSQISSWHRRKITEKLSPFFSDFKQISCQKLKQNKAKYRQNLIKKYKSLPKIIFLFFEWLYRYVTMTFWSLLRILTFFPGGKFDTIKSANIWLTIQVFALVKMKSNDFKVVQEMFYLSFSNSICSWIKNVTFVWLTFLLTY